jgi:hypothetical protein
MWNGLPADVVARYCPACGDEIRAKSYGRLRAARIGEGDGLEQRGTFDDQAIFGPKRNFACACGKYDGHEYKGIICDRCGVRVTTTAARRRRCGHINLTAAVVHPLGSADDELNAWPVLPVSFVEAPGGLELLRAYDAVLRGRDAGEILIGVEMVLSVLAPLMVAAHRWDLSERLLIAHGMGLKQRAA